MATISKDWIELKTEKMINRARSSQFKQHIIDDARRFHSEGYQMDVALMMSLKYWEGNPITGEVVGIEVEA